MPTDDDTPVLFHIPHLTVDVDSSEDSGLAPTRCEYTLDIYVGDKLRKLRVCRSAHTGSTQLYLDSRLLYSRDLQQDGSEADFSFDMETAGVRLLVRHAGSAGVHVRVAKGG